MTSVWPPDHSKKEQRQDYCSNYLATYGQNWQAPTDTQKEGPPEQQFSSPVPSDGNTESGLCRICHDGAEAERLISPCSCSGSMGLVHLSCLESWLTTSQNTHCELCQYEYHLRSATPSMKQFFKGSGLPGNQWRSLARDIVCFLVLTPATLISAYLCLIRIRHITEMSHWRAAALIAFETALVLVYLGWLGNAVKYHYYVLRKWRKEHTTIQVICASSTSCTTTPTTDSGVTASTENCIASSSDEGQKETFLVVRPIFKYISSWRMFAGGCRQAQKDTEYHTVSARSTRRKERAPDNHTQNFHGETNIRHETYV